MGKSHRSKKLKIHEEDLRREREEAERKAALAQKRAESAAVSYTHLTLPTILLV